MPQNIGQAYVQIVPSADGISGSIEKVLAPEATSAGTKAGGSIAKGIGSALMGGTAAVAAGITAVTGTIIKGTSDLGAYGDNIDKMSQKMGLSRQAYQEWDAVMQHSGTSMEAMKASMKTLANAAQTDSDAFKALGISTEQLQTMSQQELFEATITALQNVESETERTYLAGKTLGRGATELGALLNTSAEDTQKMRDRVRELGGVMSDEAVMNAALFQDNLQDLQTAISGVGRGIMADLMPGMNSLMEGFTMLIAGESGASDAIIAGIDSLGTAVQGITTNVIGIANEILPGFIQAITTALPQLIPLATTIITTLATSLVQVLPMLLTTVLPALVEAGIQLVIGLAQAIIQTAPELLAAGQELFTQLSGYFSAEGAMQMLEQGLNMVLQFIAGIIQSLPEIIAQGSEIILNIVNGMLTALPELITIAGEAITTFLNAILPYLPQIWTQGTQLLLKLLEGIVQALPQIVTTVFQVIAKILAEFAKHLPKLLQQGFELLGEVAKGIIKAIPDLIGKLPEVFNSIVDSFKEFDWASIGKNILDGIGQGITNAIDTVVNAAKSAGGKIKESLASFFNIGSPSKVMADEIGRWLPPGIAVGFLDNLNPAIESMQGGVQRMVDGLQYSALDAQQPVMDPSDRLIDAMSRQSVNVTVTLQGDAQKLFRMVNQTNERRTRATNYNALAMG